MTDYSVFDGVSGPGGDGGDPADPINLGMIFQATGPCWLKAIRFWRGATTITGTPKGRLFKVADQSIQASVTFPTLSGTGWQTANLTTPMALDLNTSYKVVVHFDDNYSATGGYWASGAGVGGRVSGPLTAPDAGGTPLGIGSIKQGSYAVTSNPDIYPDSYFNGANYWVDVVVTDVDPAGSHTGTGTAPLTLAATGAGAKHAASSSTAPVTLAASGVGSKHATGTGTAAITLAASGSGAKSGAGVAVAPLALAASGVGVHRGVGAATAALGLAASGVGVHHGVGTGTAPLTLSAHGAPAGRDITLTVGQLRIGWVPGELSTGWATGDLEV